MTDNDNDGERELVLGNKQLLGIFFVATLLCGVFFAMGYVVGGNSAKSSAAAAAEGTATPVSEGKREEPQAQSTASQPTMDTAANSPYGGPGDTGSALPTAEPRVTDNPAAAGAQPPVAPPPAPVQQPAPVATTAKTAPASTPTPGDTGIFVSVPEKGTRYWQVTATERPVADTLVRSLRDRQLPAILAASPNPKLFEVLVGPYRSDVALADAKKKLADIGGFDGVFVKKF